MSEWVEGDPPKGRMVWAGHESGLMEPAIWIPSSYGNGGFWRNSFTLLPLSWRPRYWCEIPTPPKPNKTT